MSWALCLVVLLDVAQPLAPGAFTFEQTIEAARRLPVQAAVAKLLPPAPHRFPTKDAPRIVAERPRREANHSSTNHFDLHPIRSPQLEAAAPTAVDPA